MQVHPKKLCHEQELPEDLFEADLEGSAGEGGLQMKALKSHIASAVRWYWQAETRRKKLQQTLWRPQCANHLQLCYEKCKRYELLGVTFLLWSGCSRFWAWNSANRPSWVVFSIKFCLLLGTLDFDPRKFGLLLYTWERIFPLPGANFGCFFAGGLTLIWKKKPLEICLLEGFKC